jgi:ABC-type sulfate transport system permease component
VTMRARSRTALAWGLFLATLGCLVAGVVVALVVVRPLTPGVLGESLLAMLLYLGFAAIGLVLSLRRPANPIGWLYAASGLAWSVSVPGEVWVGQLVRSGRPTVGCAPAAGASW